MFENLKLRWVLILGALFFGFYFSFPTFQYFTTSEKNIDKISSLKDKAINLGLDLRGGLHIVLELDERKFLEKLIRSKLSQKSKDSYKKLLDKAELMAIKNNTNIIIQLNRVASDAGVKLNKYFSNLSKSTDNNILIEQIKDQKSLAMSSILEIMRNRIQEHDVYGLGEPSIQKLGENRLMVELAGIDDVSRAKKYIQRTADFELALVKTYDQFLDQLDKIDNYIANNNLDFISLDSLIFAYAGGFYVNESNYSELIKLFNDKEINDLINQNSKIVWNSTPVNINKYKDSANKIQIRQLYLVSNSPAISSGMIKTPKAIVSDIGSTNAGQWVVNLDMTKEGRKKWSKFTGANIDRQVAIILDNKVFMAPVVRDKISSGSTQISGFEDMQEAKDIASILKAGELPAPINIIQTNYVGPSLGQDSINSGAQSMLIGLCLVLVFMFIYYNGSGMIANIALIFNLIIVFGVLVSMNAILTLPGIAGLLLTVGMTIDANVIIFERIREEIKSGKKPFNAMNSGYKRAFETILDANITTLLTAFVLSFIGSGPIKGFATTLSVGIICSMFTAIFVTKTIFLTIFNFNKIKKLSI